MTKLVLTSVAALGFSAAAAAAATVEFSDSVALTTTNWMETLSVSQFDTALGTLNSVMVTLSGSVEGEAKAESLDMAPATVTLDLSALISATTAVLGNVGTVLPIASESADLAAFDGGIDFAGASGTDTGTVSADDTDSNTYFGADMAEFVGGGNLDIDISALGQSTGSGAGNLITQFGTRAAATITVTYDFTEVAAVPLPAGAFLLGGALFGLGFARRGRKA